MSQPFLGEIRIMSFNFPPKGWAACNGQLLAINQNQALFSILGTTYGGNGQTTFGLPDFRGRLPAYVGQGLTLGEKSGEETHTLIATEMPQHFHLAQVQPANATTGTPNGAFLGGVPSFAYRTNLTDPVVLRSGTVSLVGGSQSHENRIPSLVLNFCIALQGIFPSRN